MGEPRPNRDGHRLGEAAKRTTEAMQRLERALRPETHLRIKELETRERREAFDEALDLFAREGIPVHGTADRATHWLAFLEGVEHGHRERDS